MSKTETDRSALLNAAKWFLENISKRDDIEKIAFFGSICTDKEHPKDIDVLVYLKPKADIKAIAVLKRKFGGRIGKACMGADVFLVEDGKYIGRACRYKEPWVRVVCAQEGLRCNRERQHLCDTSYTVTLKQEIIDNPPVIALPEFSASVPIPDDLQKICEIVQR